jgi:ferrous iron transport protein A
MQRLMSMGLVPGVTVKVIRVAPLGDPVMLEVSGYQVCIRRRESEFLTLFRAGQPARPRNRQESKRAVADTTRRS